MSFTNLKRRTLSELMRKEYLTFGSPYIEEDVIDAVVTTLRSGWIGTGPRVHQFEEQFGRYKNAQQAVAVSSCTSALHLCLLASRLNPGDEVILPALTFCATANAVIHARATPVLADVDPKTMNISLRSIQEVFTEKTRAIIVVHFAGRPCEMNPIMAFAAEKKLIVIEDCAHAIESEYLGRPAGTFGQFGCFSFYVTKNITTGEGGMALVKDKAAAEKIKRMALHGLSQDAWSRYGDDGYQHYYVTDLGYKYNMTDLQASIGLQQLAKVDEYWERRREIWHSYDRAFKNLPVGIPTKVGKNIRHGYHLYTLLISREISGVTRDEFIQRMHKRNIGTGVHYISLADQPFYREKFNWESSNYPASKKIGETTVSLPLSPKLSDYDVETVIKAVQKSLLN